jgi:tetratricopeptide (TPR) repeat protein
LREGASSQELAEELTQGVADALAPLLEQHPGLWAISPEFAPAWEEDGDKALAAEDFAKARLDFLAAVTADGASPIYHRKLAQALVQAGQLAKAQSELETARQLDPKSIDTLLALGEVFLQLGNPGRASGYFESAGLIDEQDPRPKGGLAKANLRRGNIAPALKLYDALLVRYPKDAAIHRAYGEALVEAKQPRKAIGEFRRALELNPKDRVTRQALTRTLLGEGNLPEGIEQLRLLSQDSSGAIALSAADYGRTMRYWTAEFDAVLRGLDPLLAKYRQGAISASQASEALQILHSRSDNLARLAEKIAPPQELDRSQRYWVLAANLANQSDFEALRYVRGQGEEILRRAQLFRQAAVAASQEARAYAASAPGSR